MGISRIALFYWGVSLSYLGTWKGNFCTAIYEEVAGVSRYSPCVLSVSSLQIATSVPVLRKSYDMLE